MKNITFKYSENDEEEESEGSTISLSDEEVDRGQNASVPEGTNENAE